MICPRCQQSLRLAAEACTECGFSLTVCDKHFGSDCVVMDRVMDAVSCFTPQEMYQLEVRLAAFEKEFPQLFFAVYTDAIPPGNPIMEFSFWLLNRAAIRGIDIDRPNENGILLCLDLNTSSATLTTGFCLEPILPQKTLHSALKKARGAWMDRQFGEGIARCVDAISRDLRKIANDFPQGGQNVIETMPAPLRIVLPRGLESIRGVNQLPDLIPQAPAEGIESKKGGDDS